MVQNIYTIRDERAEICENGIFLTDNEAKAIKGFEVHCRALNNDKVMNAFIKDLALYHVGKFDDQTGKVSAEEPTLILRGSQFKFE